MLIAGVPVERIDMRPNDQPCAVAGGPRWKSPDRLVELPVGSLVIRSRDALGAIARRVPHNPRVPGRLSGRRQRRGSPGRDCAPPRPRCSSVGVPQQRHRACDRRTTTPAERPRQRVRSSRATPVRAATQPRHPVRPTVVGLGHRRSRAARVSRPGPWRSARPCGRPARATRRASPGPRTSGPLPWVQLTSVATTRSPRPFAGAGSARARGANSKAATSRS